MTKEKRKLIHEYLISYKYYTAARDGGLDVPPSVRAEAFSVYRSIVDMPPSKEKLLLYYHYVRGQTLESCAEQLGVSRRTVFRLKQSALELYAANVKNDAAIAFLS